MFYPVRKEGNVKISSWTVRKAANLALAVMFMVGMQHVLASEFVTDDNVAHCVGQVCKVEGLLAAIFVSKNNDIVLAFGKPYPNQTFTAVIDADAAMQFQNIQAYEGHRTLVTGLVKLNGGRPEAVLSHPSQLALAPRTVGDATTARP